MKDGSGSFARAASDRVQVRENFVAFAVTGGDRAWTTAAALRVPAREGRHPTIVIVHGSSGVDSRGGAHARALNAAGLATLEIDLWAAHGVLGPQTRPRSPFQTVPDVFAALSFLAARADIDPGRIGLMGFSWGGVMTMLAATRAVQERFGAGRGFTAFAPFYPVTWIYNHAPGMDFRDLVGPVLLQVGAMDRYDDPDTAEKLVAGLDEADRARVTLKIYPGATHAWDRREDDMIVDDPTAHKGKGGPTPFSYDPDVTQESSDAVIAFFAEALQMKS